MRPLHTLFLAGILAISCNSVKNIYQDENVNERQYEKLVAQYQKKPNDTALSNRVIFAYQSILQNHLENISRLEGRNDLQSLASLVNAYSDLQDFYNNAAPVSKLVHPGNVEDEKQVAKEKAAEAWYAYASSLVDDGGWKNGREALNVCEKVNQWKPGYRETSQLMVEAVELATLDAVIQPLRSEGFYSYGSFNPSSERFSFQLASDLGNNRYNNKLYRVYDAEEANRYQVAADWIIEPVITRFQVDPVNYNRYTRTVTKSIETGKDSLKNPVYKTITAELSITEASVCVSTELETRISDLQYREQIGRRSFTETITLKETSATYKGDRKALSSEDWALVNNRNRPEINERWLQQKLLEKIYPDMLSYLRGRLR
jgi:hypothetical protein